MLNTYTNKNVYNAFGESAFSYVSKVGSSEGWTKFYRYEPLSKLTISTETNPELLTKDNWIFFDEVSKLPLPDSVISSFEFTNTDKGKSGDTGYFFHVNPTSDCEKHLRVLSDACGFEINSLGTANSAGEIIKDGNTIANYNFYNSEKVEDIEMQLVITLQ